MHQYSDVAGSGSFHSIGRVISCIYYIDIELKGFSVVDIYVEVEYQ